uniref:Uncharacterized protein n=1 Tax=Avena sativa TaxID=4498 RepID=A0ACD5TQM5_AVESA
MSSTADDWCDAIVKSLPNIRVLSLSFCSLVGPICPSLSNLHSLTVINLQGNFFTHAFPEFFMGFLNLSVLNLAETNIQGLFPHRTFQSKALRVLDLSGNQDLSGHMPNFSNASSLEAMMVDGTKFSFAKPGSYSNFKYLKTLSLDVNSVPVEPQSSLGILRSVQHLELSQMGSATDLGPILSLIFSQTSLSSVAKLKSLRSLTLTGCNDIRPVLFDNLVGLTNLDITSCNFNGPIPSAIGNLTNLKSLKINGCEFLGSIPSSVGNLRNLRNLEISGFTEYSGVLAGSSSPIPASIGNLSNLERLDINCCGFSGPIPDEVGLLKKLTILRIGFCSLLSGRIPNSIVNLTRLIDLDLSYNLLNGKIVYLYSLMNDFRVN